MIEPIWSIAFWAAFSTIIAGTIFWQRKQRRVTQLPVADEPGDGAYHVFTREFDLEIDAATIPAALKNPDWEKGWRDRDGGGWAVARSLLAEAQSPDNDRSVAEKIGGLLGSISPSAAGNLAVTLLVDQSGSSRGAPMIRLAAAIQRLKHGLTLAGVTV
jgi:hypothetical protein